MTPDEPEDADDRAGAESHAPADAEDRELTDMLRGDFFDARSTALSLDGKQARSALLSRMFGVAADPVTLGGFRIVRRLGQGAMGVVYEAIELATQRRVALKTLRGVDPRGLYRLKQEFRSIAGLHHPGLVSLYELHAVDGHVFFSMELIDGCDFLAYTRGRDRDVVDRPPDHARLRHALRQLLEAIEAMHLGGLLHRDIKPSNVLVTSSGRVVLLDFGLALDQRPEAFSSAVNCSIAGTPAYMAPEQASAGETSPAADLYAVGVLLYQSLTGRLPHVADDLASLIQGKCRQVPRAVQEVIADVPPDLAELCMSLLHREPQQRPRIADILARSKIDSDDSSSRLERRTGSGLELFVGRADELQRLERALVDSETTPVLLHLVGGSGLGKSTLLRQFVDRMRREHRATVLLGRCFERESVPYKTLDSLIDNMSRWLGRLSPAEAAALQPRDMDALARLFPVLAGVESLSAAPRRHRAFADVQELRRRAAGALRELLARMTDRRPLVLCIDDVHWGDVEGARLLLDLVRGDDPPNMLVVLSYRQEELGCEVVELLRASARDPQIHARTDEVRLTALGERNARELAQALLGQLSGPLELESLIALEARGNPLFVRELARHASEQWLRERQTTAPSLNEIVARRLQALAPEARALMELLAVAGTTIPTRVAQAVHADAMDLAMKLRSAQFVRIRVRDGTELIEVDHELLREITLASMNDRTVMTRHLELAQAMLHEVPFDPAAVAQHLAAGGDVERAAPHAIAAAEAAAQALAFEHAAKLYEIALESTKLGPDRRRAALTGLADAFANTGLATQAARGYLAALDGASSDERFRLRRCAAEQLLQSGHLEEGLPVLRSVLAEVGLALPRSRTRARLAFFWERLRLRCTKIRPAKLLADRPDPLLLARADACWSAGAGLTLSDPVVAAVFHGRRLRLAFAARDPRRVLQSLVICAAQIAARGTAAEAWARRLAAVAGDVGQLVAEPRTRALLLLLEGIRAYAVGRWRDALEACDQAATVFQEECPGTMWETTVAQMHAESALFWLGRTFELAGRVQRHAADARQRGDLLAEVSRRVSGLGCIGWLTQDQPEIAQRDRDDTLARWGNHGLGLQVFWALQSQTMIDLYRGQFDACWQQHSTTGAERSTVIRRIEVMRMASLGLRGAAAISAALHGTRADALLDAQRIELTLTRQSLPWCRALGLVVRAGLAVANERPDRAILALREAVGGFETYGMDVYAAAARRQWGALLVGSEGARLIASGESVLRAQKVIDFDRFSRVFVPQLTK